MVHHAIGNIQGCSDELTVLLDKISFNHGTDTFWPISDIVDHGPKSPESLQLAMRYENSVQITLGNHDLHLLTVGFGHGSIKRSDIITPILKYVDSKKMFDWLRAQLLMISGEKHVVAHAGVLLQWSVAKVETLACEVEAELKGKRAEKLFSGTHGNKSTAWSDHLKGYDRLRMIVSVFIRMRVLTLKSELDYDYKSTLDQMPPSLRLWFKVPDCKYLSHITVFDHRSSLGYMDCDRTISLDIGALWGGGLTTIDPVSNQITQVLPANGPDWKKPLK